MSTIKLLALSGLLSLAGLTTAFSHCGLCADNPNPETSSSEGESSPDHHYPAIWHHYFTIQESLAADNVEGAKKGAEDLAGFLTEEQKESFAKLMETCHLLAEAQDIAQARTHFSALSQEMIALMEKGECPSIEGTLYRAHCPMAFGNQGGDWIQKGKEVANPYFGAHMPHCGTVHPMTSPSSDK